MTSACIFRDTLGNETQVFLKIGDSNFEICLHLINSNFTFYFLPSSMLSSGAETSMGNRASRNWIIITRKADHFPIFIFAIQLLDQEIYSISFIQLNMASNVNNQ